MAYLNRFASPAAVNVYAFVYFLAISTVSSLDIRWCRQPMGLQSGVIPDSALSATSAFDGPSVGPQHARLHVDKSGGAWCPKQQIAESVNEFLEIDFSTVSVISGIATQGRYGNGRGQEYAEAFRLEYWRPELSLWHPYHRWDGNEILEGNTDTNTAVHHDLNPPIIAQRLRIIPYGIYPRTVCMRVELYGCHWNEHIVSYSIPVGNTWSDALTVDDLFYDGLKETNVWTNGLGMLTDGHYGLDNFKMDLGARKGHGWVGWRNESMKSPPVELVFHFDGVRNLSAVHIHTNNYFTKNVQVFSKASLRFSVGGEVFSGKPITYFYMEDLVMENARNVTIRIPHVCAAYVKIQFWFASQWIMISEINFSSEPVESFIAEELPEIPPGEEDGEDLLLDSRPNTHSETGMFNTVAESAQQHGFFEAIVGALSAVMLLLMIAIVVIVLMNHRKKTKQETLVTFTPPFDAAGNVKISPPVNLLEDAVVGINTIKHTSNPGLIFIEHANNLEIINEPDDSGYATTDVAGSSQSVRFSSLRPNPLHRTQTNMVDPNGIFPRIATDPISRRSCSKAGHLKSTATIAFAWNIKPLADSFLVDNSKPHIPEIPRNCLRLVEWLGSSDQGEAYVCQITSNSDYENSAMQQPVVVRGGPVKEIRSFQTEIKLLSTINHQNLVSLLAFSCSNGTGWMIFECPVYGDLNSYLKQQTNDINTKSVLKFATQIGQAIHYLEGRGIIHKDLATRNCLLGPELQVKVSDLAVVSAVFKEDYGEVRGRKPLPLRWLPWENLVLGKFSESSSVWMMAVTVWEIATTAKERPYSSMSDTQVILNADHFYYTDGKQVILPQPMGCPNQLYQWMISCWSREETERPTIDDTLSFLAQMIKCY